MKKIFYYIKKKKNLSDQQNNIDKNKHNNKGEGSYNKVQKYYNKYKRQRIKRLNIYRALRNKKDKWFKRKISKKT